MLGDTLHHGQLLNGRGGECGGEHIGGYGRDTHSQDEAETPCEGGRDQEAATTHLHQDH